MAKKIRLIVAGGEYYINTDEAESYIHGVAGKVDKRMGELSHANPCLSTTMAAVLCALELCDENCKLKQKIADLELQLKHRTEESACAGLEADQARREIERLNRENIRLRDKAAGR